MAWARPVSWLGSKPATPPWSRSPIGKGRLVVLASGWQPADSQLARSSKFVPLMAALLEGTRPQAVRRDELRRSRPRAAAGRRRTQPRPWSSTNRTGPSSRPRPTSAFFAETDQPGLYTVDTAGRRSVVRGEPRSAGEQDGPLARRNAGAARLPAGGPFPKNARPRAAPADVQHGARKSPEALALADSGGDRRPDRRNLAGGATSAAAPLRPRGGTDDMSRQLQQALERVAQPIPAGAALGWPGGLLAGVGRGRLGLGAIGLRSESVSIPSAWLPCRSRSRRWRRRSCASSGRFRSARDPRWVARRIEPKYPDLKTGLLAAVEETASAPPAGSASCSPPSSAKPSTIAVSHDWDETVPTRTLRGAQAGARRRARVASGRARQPEPCRRGRPRVPRRRSISVEPNAGRRPGRAGQHRDRARHVAPGRRAVQGRRPGRRESRRGKLRAGRGAPGHDAQPGRPDVCRPRRVGRSRPLLSRRIRGRRAPRPITSRCSNTPSSSAPTPSWSSRSIRRSSPRPSRIFGTSPRWRAPS